jgi:cysteine sulfinate desulfinase/cysteine desulfurase-like protein
MQVPIEWALGTVRFSVGRQTTVQEIDQAVEIVSYAVKKQYQAHRNQHTYQQKRFEEKCGC